MNEKIRVVVYCRVSTKADNQNLSFESQKEYYEQYVNSHPNWELINIYAEKTTGTNVNRPEFKKMMLEAGIEVIQTDEEFIVRNLGTSASYDLIIVKDEKRFSRTMDITPILSALRKKGIGVFFENINKSTLDVEDILTINMLLSVADNFSKSLSKNLKTSINKNQRLNPHYNLGHTVPIGFSFRKENGRTLLFPTDEKSKKDFKRMFELYANEGYGFRRCALFLTEQGYRTTNDLAIQPYSVERILRNPCYMGCIRVYNHTEQTLAQLGHRKAKYLPEEMVDFIKCDDITPMISEELWYKAFNTLKGKDLQHRRGIKTTQTIYSKLLRCNCCGNIFVKTNKRGEDVYVCKTKKGIPKIEDTVKHRFKKEYCRNAYIDTKFINEYFENLIKEQNFINDFKARINGHIEYITFYKYALIETFFKERDFTLIAEIKKQINDIRDKEDKLLDTFENVPKEVIERKINKYEDEIKELQKELDKAEFSYNDFKEDFNRLNYLLKFLSSRKIQEVKTKEELFPLVDEVLVSPTYSEEEKPMRNKVEFRLFSKAETEIQDELFDILGQMTVSLNSDYNSRWQSRALFTNDEMEYLDNRLQDII